MPSQTDSNSSRPRRTAAFRRLAGELSPYRRDVLAVGALTLLGVGTQVAAPWLIGVAIDRGIARGDRDGLAMTMLLLLTVYLAMALSMRGQMSRLSAVARRVLASLRARVAEQCRHLPLKYFHHRPVGDLLSRVGGDVETLYPFYSQNFFLSAIGFAFMLAAMLALDVRLALVSFTIIPAMFVASYFIAARARRAYRAARETNGKVSAELQEEISGVREAQAFNRARVSIARFRRYNSANRHAGVGAAGVASMLAPAIDVLTTIGVAIVLGYGSYLVLEGSLTVGLLAAFLIYAQQFFRPIQFISMGYGQLQGAAAGAERLFSLLDEEREEDEATATLETHGGEAWVEFEGVSFAYEPGRPVLEGISFLVAPGQTVALVGETGAGKTTIAHLLLRFYDASEGAVRVNGVDVRAVSRRSLRAQVGAVFQEPFLFSGTVAENIAYGRPAATRAEVEDAARAVNAHHFISRLPQGYDTTLGADGVKLSQGQRQMLSFARAVLAAPPILVLDEATSNVDIRTERQIQDALTRLLDGRTSIVIAHRLSTVRRADLILVLSGGKIVEQGTHEELLGMGGRYTSLYRSQFR